MRRTVDKGGDPALGRTKIAALVLSAATAEDGTA